MHAYEQATLHAGLLVLSQAYYFPVRCFQGLYSAPLYFSSFLIAFPSLFLFYMQGHKFLPCILARTENYFKIHMLLKMHILFKTMYILLSKIIRQNVFAHD
uniref:Uncharacterized protein n=1 Tax=Triticum urartu TaxID=4572 RepID=A0A8R7P9Y0_TRIUA